jgi:hypothetical protein
MNYLLLATEEPLPLPKGMPPTMRDAFIITGAVLLVAVGLFLWAAAARKRHRRRSTPHRPDYHHHSSEPASEGGEGEARHSHYRRRRRRRREHRPRNPTLAETGGLPPIRSDVPSKPPPASPPT